MHWSKVNSSSRKAQIQEGRHLTPLGFKWTCPHQYNPSPLNFVRGLVLNGLVQLKSTNSRRENFNIFRIQINFTSRMQPFTPNLCNWAYSKWTRPCKSQIIHEVGALHPLYSNEFVQTKATLHPLFSYMGWSKMDSSRSKAQHSWRVGRSFTPLRYKWTHPHIPYFL